MDSLNFYFSIKCLIHTAGLDAELQATYSASIVCVAAQLVRIIQGPTLQPKPLSLGWIRSLVGN